MDKPKFVYVSYINTTPEKLWEALIKPEFTRQYWFDTSIESDWKVGQPVHFRRGGEITDEQVLLKFEPHRLLSYTWHPLHDPELREEKPSRVTFEIESLPGKPGSSDTAVKLTVTHDDFPDQSKMFPRIQNGWPAVLSGLKSLVENGEGLHMHMAPCQSAKHK